MPDETPTTDTTATSTETSTETAATADPEGLGDAGKRALAAERQAVTDAKRQIQTLTEQLTAEKDRATAFEAANTDLTGRVEALDLQVTRLNVGIDKGLTRAFVDRLQGSDTDTFSADADALLALVPQPGRTTPRPDPSVGPRTPASTDPAAEFAAALKRATGR